MKKNWPMLVVLGLAGTGCELDPGTLFRGDGGSAGIGAGGGENAGAGGIGGTGGIGAGGAAPMDPECLDKPDGMPLAAQTAGDCVVLVCDGEGHRRVELSPEDADDFDPCTKDECKNQEAVHSLLAAGTVLADQVDGDCSEKQCNAQGGVVEIADDMDTGALAECHTVSCENGVKTTQIAQSGASCAGGASECNSDGLCVNWCPENVGFPGEALQSVAGGSYAIATGDLNGDGKPDLVFADRNSLLRVMMHVDGAKLAVPVTYGTGAVITSIAIADVNGDMKNDVVITDYYANQVAVYFNQGDGTLGSETSYATAGHPRTVIVHDLDGINGPDLVASNEDSQNVSVLLNQGNGTFATAVNFGAGGYSSSVVAVELNGDGLIDLAVANSAVSNGVSVLFGAGDGTFSAPKNSATGFATSFITAADLDGSGKSDLVVSYATGVVVMLNQGNGNFTFSTYPTGKAGYRMTTAYLNSDSHLDIAVANYTDGTVSTLFNKGDGTFEKAINYAVGNQVAEVVAADFTGDGAPDLVASNGTGYLRMLENDGKGNFPPAAPHYETGTKPTSIAARDFNGDNVPDLAVTNFFDNTVSILLNDKSGKLKSVAKPVVPGQPSTVVSEDFDGDGDFDLAVSESSRGYVAVLINEGNSVFAQPVEYLSGAANADTVASADVDGDKDFDLLVAHRNGAGGGTLGVLRNDGKGKFDAPDALATFAVGDQVAGTARSTLGVADLNGDGKPDVVVGRVDSTFMYLLLNDGNGSFVYSDRFDTSAGIGYFAIADLDGDSWRDVVVNHTRIMRNNRGPNPTFSILGYHTHDAGTVAIADLDGDGKPDMVNANATRAELTVFMNNGQGVFPSVSSAKHYAAGVHESYNGSIVASDLNADGRPDLAVIDDDGVNIYLNTCMP